MESLHYGRFNIASSYNIIYYCMFRCSIQVWSGHLGKPLQCLGEEKDGPVKCVALSPDGEWVAVGHHEGFVKMYEVSSGEVKHGRVYRYM